MIRKEGSVNMHSKSHRYQVQILWTGNTGQGTSSYRGYERSHTILIPNKPPILGSSDPSFRGDRTKYNPEDLFVASLSSCHMLWYLHLCTEASIVVTDYQDNPVGTMVETANGSGHFTEVILNPIVAIANSDPPLLDETNRHRAEQLHETAHQFCFLANSVNFPVRCKPTIHLAQATG